jgi:hypothetical protein
MIKRMFLSLCLIAVLFAGLPTQAFAAGRVKSSGYVPIMPLWSHTFSVAVMLSIDNNGRAVMSGSVIGQTGTERISVNAVLERINTNGTTTHIASWNNIQSTGSVWLWERPHYVARGHQYRLTLTSTVFRNGTSETVSMSRTAWAN